MWLQRSQHTTTENTATIATVRKSDGHSGVKRASQRATLRNVDRKSSTYAITSTTLRLALKTRLSLAKAPERLTPEQLMGSGNMHFRARCREQSESASWERVGRWP